MSMKIILLRINSLKCSFCRKFYWSLRQKSFSRRCSCLTSKFEPEILVREDTNKGIDF